MSSKMLSITLIVILCIIESYGDKVLCNPKKMCGESEFKLECLSKKKCESNAQFRGYNFQSTNKEKTKCNMDATGQPKTAEFPNGVYICKMVKPVQSTTVKKIKPKFKDSVNLPGIKIKTGGMLAKTVAYNGMVYPGASTFGQLALIDDTKHIAYTVLLGGITVTMANDKKSFTIAPKFDGGIKDNAEKAYKKSLTCKSMEYYYIIKDAAAMRTHFNKDVNEIALAKKALKKEAVTELAARLGVDQPPVTDNDLFLKSCKLYLSGVKTPKGSGAHIELFDDYDYEYKYEYDDDEDEEAYSQAGSFGDEEYSYSHSRSSSKSEQHHLSDDNQLITIVLSVLGTMMVVCVCIGAVIIGGIIGYCMGGNTLKNSNRIKNGQRYQQQIDMEAQSN